MAASIPIGRLLFAAIPMLLSVASCAVVSEGGDLEYPRSWGEPLVAGDGECASIAGDYNYVGESGDDSEVAYRPKIDAIAFFASPIRGKPEKARIAHDVVSNVISVRFLGRDLNPEKWTSFEQDFECRDGWISFGYSSAGSVDGTPVKSSRRIFLAKSNDEYLIVHHVYEVESSFLWTIKNQRKGSSWYRFQRIKVSGLSSR